MPRCSYPKCDRVVRNPNRFNLCHVHNDMADFFLWFSETLQKMQQLAPQGAKNAAVRPSGLIVPPR